jgi:hypothetical protein
VRLDRRLRRSLVLAAVLLVAATGWRSMRIVDAWAGSDATLRRVDVEGLNGGLRLDPDPTIPGAYRVRTLRSGRVELLLPGASVHSGGHRLTLDDSGPGTASRVILRRDWTVFAPSDRCGHRRVDFGSDPLGRADGVRDRIVLPSREAGAGWFRLEPDPSSGRDCFRFEDRGGVLVIERDGLVVIVGGNARPVAKGDRIVVRRAFDVRSEDPAVELRVAWESVTRALPVVADGAIVGYRDDPGIDFVVRSVQVHAGASTVPRVRIEDDDGTVLTTTLADSGPTILFGRRDRVGPLRGRVLPTRAPNEELEGAVRSGLADGWILLGAGRTRVTIPRDDRGRPAGMAFGTARTLIGLMETWDRARAPVAVRVGVGLRPAGGTAADDRGRVPLRWEAPLEAWVPSHRPFAHGPVEFRIPIVAGVDAVEVSAAFPLAWSVNNGEPTTLPAPPFGQWATHSIPVDGADVLRLRLDARPPPDIRTDRVAVSIAGGPEDTFLAPVRRGRRAFDGWREAGADGAAARAWDRVPGDRWAVAVDAEPPGRRARSGFLRVPITARRGGWIALDITLPGPVREALWNGAAVDLDRLPSGPAGGSARVSLRSRAGANLLVLRFEQLPTAPAQEAGGVRFAVDDAGKVRGLDPRIVDRRARAAVRSVVRTPVVLESRPVIVVESGIPGFESGTVWRPSPGDHPGESELIVLDGPGVVRRNAYGRIEATADGLRWRNGPAMALGVVRRVDTDPDGPPLSGFRVAPSALQPLAEDGDAILAPVFRTELRASVEGEAGGTTIVVASGVRHQLLDAGTPAWRSPEDEEDWAPVVLRVAVRWEGRMTVRSSRPASLWTRAGDRREIGDEWTPWPEGARIVWTDPAGPALRLQRRTAEYVAAIPGDTVDPDLQRAAESVLTRVVGDRGQDDGDPLSLRAAVLALDPITGDILACASREREGADPRTRVDHPCWQDVGLHPGSTFKIGVAIAALASEDPSMRRMVDGRLPAGLRRGGPRAELRGARLPPLPLLADLGEGRRLRSRLENHRRHLMPTDATLEDALRSSLNTWFGYAGLLMHRPLREGWGSAGIADVDGRSAAWPVAEVADAAGFGRRIELGAGRTGTGGRFPHVSVEGDAPLAARSIGQGDVTATPLGIATLLAPVVADGWTPVPRLSSRRPLEKRRVMSVAAAERLRLALHDVVLRGTASRAFSDHPRRELMLGKTGSAQRVDSDGVTRTDAWFAGAIVPPEGAAGRPVVFVAVLPGGGLGGRTAAEVVDALSRELILLRGWDLPPAS